MKRATWAQHKIRLVLLLLLSNLLACTPMIHPSKAPVALAQLSNNFFITPDGAKLPLKKWQSPHQEIKNIIIAIHGFNDYSNFFQQPGHYFSQHQTTSYAYDQRGFGKSPNRGLWAGIETYTSDLACFVQLISQEHPKTPIYLLGESMGAAVVISTVSQAHQLPVEGIILVAPAVWGRQTMPWYQNILLWTLSHITPWLTLTGNGLGIKASDNIAMLRALSQDPLVIKATRIETLYGLTNLMDNALLNAGLIAIKTLLLYGEKDEIIPPKSTYQFIRLFNKNAAKNHPLIAFYEQGYHMLLRDHQAPVLWNDINVWISGQSTKLPSGADRRAHQLLNTADMN